MPIRRSTALGDSGSGLPPVSPTPSPGGDGVAGQRLHQEGEGKAARHVRGEIFGCGPQRAEATGGAGLGGAMMAVVTGRISRERRVGDRASMARPGGRGWACDDGRKMVLFFARQLAREQGLVPADTPLMITDRMF